ncbi:Oligosaccharyltransferase complex subunit ostc [Echinococcus granulosus]|nr:Oligosaccharyltransferase complex subunit ostc [Echinococcus granulosus]
MDWVFCSIFTFLECPRLRIKRPSWLQLPSRMTVFAFVLSTYFLVTGGIIFDVINGPPSVGTETDARGNQRPVAFMQWRINSQYIMEGLLCSFMFTLGAIGFILLDIINESKMTRLARAVVLSLGVACIFVSFISVRAFMKIKMPSYRF